MSAQIRWAGEGTGRVLRAQGVDVVLESTVPFPPGRPMQGTLILPVIPPAEHSFGFTLKVAGSRLTAPSTWEVRGRLISATTAVREAFARAAAPASTSSH